MDKTIRVRSDVVLAGHTCEHCRYSGSLRNGQMICRFDPPRMTSVCVGMSEQGPQWCNYTGFPCVEAGEWCGKFERRASDA